MIIISVKLTFLLNIVEKREILSHLTEKIFREINSLVISLVKPTFHTLEIKYIYVCRYYTYDSNWQISFTNFSHLAFATYVEYVETYRYESHTNRQNK